MVIHPPEPERTCVGCFHKFPQSKLVAVTRQKNGTVRFSHDRKFPGRSVYLCRQSSCFLKATKRKGKNALAYGLKVEIPPDIFMELEKLLMDRHPEKGSQSALKTVG